MLIAVGSKVRMKHTGDIGTVCELIDDTMVSVRLPDGDEIPTFIEDLERPDQPTKKAPIKAKIIQTPKPVVEKKNTGPLAKTQYKILKPLGIQLAFEANLNSDGRASSYTIFIINDTRYDILYTFELYHGEFQKKKKNGKLNAETFEELGEMQFDDLNENPSVNLEAWQITTEGTGKKLSKSFKIKAKAFFKNVLTAPLLNRPVHHYKVFEKFEPLEKKEEDLQSYTKRVAGPINKYKPDAKNSVVERANFSGELDLHIEKISPQNANKGNSDIIRIQMDHFDNFMNKAHNLGIESVFIIHGVGKGKLRDAIASRLIKNPDVDTFKNEFHPRYGFGATEVKFK